MSGYEKPTIPNLNEYNSNRPAASGVQPNNYAASPSIRNPMYLTYPEEGFGDQHVQPSASSYGRRVDQMVFPASSYYQQTTSYEASQPQFTDRESPKAPVITSYTPHRGPEGSEVVVYIESVYDLFIQPSTIFSLMFATRRCQSLLTQLEPQGSSYQYVLTADAPPFSSTGWNTTQVPLRVQFQDESGQDTGSLDVGPFYYTDGVDHRSRASPDDFSRKRKVSVHSSELIRVPAKRTSNQQLYSGSAESFATAPYSLSGAQLYSKHSQPNPLGPIEDDVVSYGNRAPSQLRFHASDASQRSLQTLPITPVNIHPLPKVPSSQPSSWGSSYAPHGYSGRSPGLAAAPTSRISSMSSPSLSANPPLIRTSTLQQAPSPAGSQIAPSSTSPFNPYAMYPHKAVLKINGDLDSMVDHWTPDEWSLKRRIVQFQRSQSGTTINADFEPVLPDDRPPNSICISCILWEERQECFVTSVDTIYLLESLVGVRFTVEEKNRIRRNLEGFRPMTVSKAKADSENFFKIIMGFPNPKPRNIEKDVKVFPWKILAHALKKIIGKYSASYSSTASALPTPRNMSYGFGDQSEASTEQSITSPRSSSASTISSAYATSLASSTTMSPRLSHDQSSTPAQYPDAPCLPISIPRRLHEYANIPPAPPPTQYPQYASQEQMNNPSLGQLAITSPPGRRSLEFTSYVATSPSMQLANRSAEPNLPPTSRRESQTSPKTKHGIR